VIWTAQLSQTPKVTLIRGRHYGLCPGCWDDAPTMLYLWYSRLRLVIFEECCWCLGDANQMMPIRWLCISHDDVYQMMMCTVSDDGGSQRDSEVNAGWRRYRTGCSPQDDSMPLRFLFLSKAQCHNQFIRSDSTLAGVAWPWSTNTSHYVVKSIRIHPTLCPMCCFQCVLLYSCKWWCSPIECIYVFCPGPHEAHWCMPLMLHWRNTWAWSHRSGWRRWWTNMLLNWARYKHSRASAMVS
jgi:hypothetical protein